MNTQSVDEASARTRDLTFALEEIALLKRSKAEDQDLISNLRILHNLAHHQGGLRLLSCVGEVSNWSNAFTDFISSDASHDSTLSPKETQPIAENTSARVD